MSAGFRKSLFGFNCEDVMEYIEKSQKSFVEREKDLSEQVEKLSAELELSNDNYRKLNEEKETISKKLEEFNENIGKLYLVAQANARAIMANSEKNAGLAAAQVQKNLSTLEEAHASLDELKKNIVRTTDEFVDEVDELIASLNDAREQISSNTVAALGSKEQFDEVYNSIVKG